VGKEIGIGTGGKMKKLIAVLIFALALNACDDIREGLEYRPNSERWDVERIAPRIVIYTIDGHEYIFISAGESGGLTHKADCKHPSHRRMVSK
jgi:hypothetical protein